MQTIHVIHYLLVEEDEVHLHEDESSLEKRPQGGEVVPAWLVDLADTCFQKEPDLDGGVYHCPGTEY